MRTARTIDTGGQCTGACCIGFTLYRPAKPGTTDDDWPVERRVGATIYYTIDDVLEEQHSRIDHNELAGEDLIFHVKHVSSHIWGDRFRCGALTSERRCGVYADRPVTCRTFPGQSHVCRSCGFSVAKQRRATRRMMRDVVNAARRAKGIAAGCGGRTVSDAT